MSRCYLDTNFLYVHLRAGRGNGDDRITEWRTRVVERLAGDSAVISALVLDEPAYRLVVAWLGEDGSPDPLTDFCKDSVGAMRQINKRLVQTWTAVDTLRLELQETNNATVARARALMAEPAMPPRDAFHAAHALEARCALIASADAGFDQLAMLPRLGPDRD